jgi:hypothetical protein
MILHATARLASAALLTMCLGTVTHAAVTPRAPLTLCVDDNCTPVAVMNGQLKWHPGHYMMIRSRTRNPTVELPQIDAIKNEAAIKGVVVTWKWSELEKSKGVYDFSSIDQYLQRAKNASKRLVIHVYDRGWGAPTMRTAPDYLHTDSTYNGGEVAMSGGTVSRVWEQPVMDRLIALYVALGKRYDSDPSVEGIQFSETSIGFNATYPAPSTYSNGAYLTQLKRVTLATRNAWPHTNVFMSTNYLGSDSQMEDLIKYCVDRQVILGGPDTWSREWVLSRQRALQADEIMRGERGSGTDYRQHAAIKAEIQTTELGGYIATFTPTQLYDTAYNINRSQYIFWDRNDYAGGNEQKWDTGILPLIRSINGKSYGSCPASFGSTGCSTK